jgi:predicted amidohydrolase YtcJ
MGCTNAEEIAAALAEKVKTIPEDGFVLGLGFAPPDYDRWSLADLARIDAVTGPRPAILVDKLGHDAIANTALMQLAQLTPDSPVPLGGKMVIEDGRLTGMMRESAMNPPLTALVALFEFDQIKAAMLGFLQRWAANGCTGCVDLMGGPGFRFMYPEVFWELEQEGKLPLRAGYCYPIFNLDDVDGALQYVGRDTALTHFVGCKIFVDGAFAGGQAWTSWTNEQDGHGLQEIYTDDRGGPGLNLNRIVARVEALGLNMHYHTQGDLAVGAVLDALDQVKAAHGAIRGIHTLIHLAFPPDEQIARIQGFDGHVVTTTQPGFWEVEQGTEYYYGARAAEAYPIQKLIAAGLSVGISTDWSVSPYDYAPATAVIGIAATGAGHPEMHQPVSVHDAIHGLTVGSAATTGRREIGRLDVGYQADMVVYDRDLYTLAPEAFTKDNPRVVATWLCGEKIECG